MPSETRPESIENRWDILYRDYPEVYEEFAQIEKRPTWIEAVNQRFGLAGRIVLDVGSGTGRSTFQLAKYADAVIGVEPEGSMMEIAASSARDQGIENVRFVAGRAEHLPLADASVDVVTAVTLASLHNEGNTRAFATESERVVVRGGLVLTANIAPGWYGGHLAPVIYGVPRSEMPSQNTRDVVLVRLGYEYFDYYATQDYGTVERAIRTYGFIFGKNAIEYIREHKVTVIRWKGRIHYKRVGECAN